MDKHYRQGDILLIKIDELPPLKFKEKKDKVVLEGEVTGHAHKLEGEAKILEVAERIANPSFDSLRTTWNINTLTAHLGDFTSGPRSQVIGYAVVDTPAELTHEEHDTITIPPGKYQIRRQREYDEEEIRFVED
ncbi:hypothetical protein ES705_33859 [subsurface metagenome]